MVRFAEWLTKRLEEPSLRIGFEVERFIIDAKEELLRAFGESGVTQREIASTLEVKESTISRALSRTHNMTLRTLCSIAVAAGFRPSIRLERLSDSEKPWRKRGVDVTLRRRLRLVVPPRGASHLGSEELAA